MNIAYPNPPMFTAQIISDDVVWEVRFLHDQHEYPAEPDSGLKYPAKAITICTVTNQRDAVEYSGVARCGMEDTFTRAVGREKSLEHALLGMHKSYRRAIWNAYWIAVGELGRVSFPTGLAANFKPVND